MVHLVLGTKIMSDKIFVNKYITDAAPKDLPLYEWDGIMTYIDQLKYKYFISDPDNYLEKAEVINFEMILMMIGRTGGEVASKYFREI